MSNALPAITEYVICYDVFGANILFGKFKDSGVCRELGEGGLKNYLDIKTVIIKRSDDPYSTWSRLNVNSHFQSPKHKR